MSIFLVCKQLVFSISLEGNRSTIAAVGVAALWSETRSAIVRSSSCPIPVITGIGHEDDLTVSDLVSDHRSATPTAAIVDLLPSRENEKNNFLQKKKILYDYFKLFVQNKKNYLNTKKSFFQSHSPRLLIKNQRTKLNYIFQLLDALSPDKWLKRGFALITDESGNSIYSIKNVKEKDKLLVQLFDGKITTEVDSLNYDKIWIYEIKFAIPCHLKIKALKTIYICLKKLLTKKI